LRFKSAILCLRVCRGSGRTVKWLDYFDAVVVGCGKPAFFNDRGQLFSVDVGTGV